MNFEGSNSELNSFDRDLRNKLSDWESGEIPDIWEGLSESLSVESVWERLDNDLTGSVPDLDQKLQDSYNGWAPAPEPTTWEKIDNSLSIESVWQNLSSSLSEPVRPSNPWMKIAVACIVALIIGNRVSDESVRVRPGDSFVAERQAVNQQLTDFASATSRSARSQQEPGDRNNLSPHGTRYVADANSTIRRTYTHVPSDDIAYDDQLTRGQNSTGNDTIHSDNNLSEDINLQNNIASLNKLPADYTNTAGLVAMPLYEPKKVISDRWTLQVGTQLSVMKETKREQLSSALPKLGFAADIAFRKRFGNLQMIGAFGVSQYTQAAGKYTNGRFSSAEQKINSLQLSGCLGYSLGRTTFYGGVVISNMFQALEEDQNKITQVYRFREIEPGMTVGADYRLLDWSRSNRPVSLGLQYQYLPGNSNGGSTFEKMHGVRLQMKFGF